MNNELKAIVAYDCRGMASVNFYVVQGQLGHITAWSSEWNLTGQTIVMTARAPNSSAAKLFELRSDGLTPSIILDPLGTGDTTKLRAILQTAQTLALGVEQSGANYDIVTIDNTGQRSPLLNGRLIVIPATTRELP